MFISQIAPLAVAEHKRTGVPASLTLAQAILESKSGTSELAVNARNLFGIKGVGTAGSYDKVSAEFVDGEQIEVKSAFRKYNDWPESVRDHSDFLLKPRYQKVLNADWRTACIEVVRAGYATDPVYLPKLIRIVEEHKLYEYDVKGAVPIILIIDPGHGGSDPGAVGNGLREKDLTLQFSVYQYERLKALGVPVALTRSTDVALTPTQRTKIVRDSGAKYCISNHINAGGGEGVEAIHSVYATDKVASALTQAVVSCGQKFRKVYTRKGADGRDYYFMHRDTGVTDTTIMEYGFIDNATDATRLKANWKSYAEAVVKAFCSVIGHKYVAPTSESPADDLAVLQAHGIINTPDYWRKNAVKGGKVDGEYAAILIGKMAGHLRK
ncbi:glucosaminidase domain-containing protein [Brevibacillus daliensis]|uniref:glucosaminidase domain-containing protein n=1 Tax=Brevibacillus daliensis TaxID=2892995 RepID=UPI001E364144|nr:glucosaminidase domain-containing protein [Brevibacillus daliensis]